MAKITELTALTAPLDTDYMVVVDESTATTKKMELQYLLVALDGDHLDVDFTPSYYTPASTPAEAADADDLAAHLYGIDQKLVGLTYNNITGSTTFTTAQRFLDVNASGGAITGTLPSAATAGAGFNYIIKLSDATNALTLATNGAETIEGLSAFYMTRTNETLEIISDGTNWKILRWDSRRKEIIPTIAYASATTVTLPAGAVNVGSSKVPLVYWDSSFAITVDQIASASGWHYLYVDTSAIDANATGKVPNINTSYVFFNTTAPTWDTEYHQWCNAGNDRCIGMVYASATGSIAMFEIGGDTFMFTSEIESFAEADVDTGDGGTTWTEVTLQVPTIATVALVAFEVDSAGRASEQTLRWRQAGLQDTGHVAVRMGGDANEEKRNDTTVTPSTAAKIEIWMSEDNDQEARVVTRGFIIPRGM